MRTSAARKTAFGAALPTRFRTLRNKSNSLVGNYGFVASNELRADRMKFDAQKVSESAGGQIPFDWRYPNDSGALEEFVESALCADFVKTPSRDNDGVADSVITQVANATQIVTVASGASFQPYHMVRLSGFTNAANNGIFRCSVGSATVPAFGGAGLVDEAAPPATARMKVIGIQGASGDIAASATGLTSTLVNFTTMGLQVGQWVKIGGSEGAAFSFATGANNGWARVTAIAANALTLDHRPAGWTADTGTGKTIRVFFGDVIRNGTAVNVLAVENSYLGQTTPTHVLTNDVAVNQLSVNFQNGQIIEGQFDCLGTGISQGTTANGSTYDASPANASMTANVSVAGIYEAGALLASPNWVRELSLSVNNNMRALPALGAVGPVRFGLGTAEVSCRFSAYFGSNALLQKLIAVQRTSLALVASAAHPDGGVGNQATVFMLPRVTLSGNGPTVPGENQDVAVDLTATASIDALTNCHIQLDTFEYVS